MLTLRKNAPIAAIAAVLLTGCATSAHKHITIDSVRAVDPSVAALSPDARLDRSLSLPGMRGVLEGTVGATTAVKTLSGGAVVSLTDLLITDRLGFATGDSATYLLGQHAQLAVPGGATPGSMTTVEDAPTLHRGDHVFIFVQTHAGGQRFATVPAAVIVLADKSATATLNTNNNTVTWQNLTEPATAFEQHFTNHPAAK